LLKEFQETLEIEGELFEDPVIFLLFLNHPQEGLASSQNRALWRRENILLIF